MSFYEVKTITECFDLLGCTDPFILSNCCYTNTLTDKGNIAFEKLRSIINFLNKSGVVDHFNEDKLDELINETGY